MIELPQELFSDHVSLRRLRPEDREALYQAALDPLIWSGHPAKTRHERAVFDPYFDLLLAAGGTMVLRDNDGRVIGCSRYYDPPDAPGMIAVGYTFVVRDRWAGQPTPG